MDGRDRARGDPIRRPRRTAFALRGKRRNAATYSTKDPPITSSKAPSKSQITLRTTPYRPLSTTRPSRMLSTTTPTRLFWAAEAMLLALAIGAAAWTSRTQDWHPLLLVGLLLALALVGQQLNLSIRGQNLSSGVVAVVLAMSLLGPAPAVLLGLSVMILTSASRRVSPALWLNNLSPFAAFSI